MRFPAPPEGTQESAKHIVYACNKGTTVGKEKYVRFSKLKY